MLAFSELAMFGPDKA